MSRVPSLTLSVDGRELTGPEAAVISITAHIGSGRIVDGAKIALASQSPVVGVAPGVEVRVDLGYDGDNETVLTGESERITQRPWGAIVDVIALPGRLHRIFLGRSYLDQSPADIIDDLANEADVSVGDLAATDALSAYHIDERRNLWRHANDLARLAGAVLRTEPDGSLSMVALAPAGGLGGLAGAVSSAASDLLGLGGSWRFGAELLDASVFPARPTPSVDVVPHGAASPLGSDKWHLLLREPDGGAPAGRTLVPAALRTEAAATTFAGGLEALGARLATGAKITTLGKPGVRPGDPISIADWPSGDPGELEVENVRHGIDRQRGFISEITLVAAA